SCGTRGVSSISFFLMRQKKTPPSISGRRGLCKLRSRYSRYKRKQSVLPQRGDGLASGVARLHLVPIADPLFAELPAEAYVAALVAADEIDQAQAVILQLRADLGQLVHVVLQVLEVDLESVLEEDRKSTRLNSSHV